mgnify:CR=1 FL=1
MSPIFWELPPITLPKVSPMARAVHDGQYKRVVMVCSSQSGKTESLIDLIGARLDQRPAPILYVGPIRDFLTDQFEPRLMSLLDEAEALSAKVVRGKRDHTPEAIAAFRQGWGLDDPLWQQYARSQSLRANRPLCSPGVKLHGAGFIVSAEQAAALGLGSVAGLEQRVRPYRSGKDLMARSRQAFVIDLQGLDEPQVQQRFPSLHAWICEHVRGPRQAGSPSGTRDAAEYARNFWLLGKPRKGLRRALAGLPRYIATAETSRHRVFVFMPPEILADNTLVCIASADAAVLATLSSRLHQTWALATGGRLGVGNHPRYNKTRCFDPFPFPACAPEPQARLRELGELLDGHRKQRQLAHPDLTLTCMYNVLEKRRRGQPLSAAEQVIDEKGGLATLQELHAAVDAAVFAAYGWPSDLHAEPLLCRLLHLHAERAQEEQRPPTKPP